MKHLPSVLLALALAGCGSKEPEQPLAPIDSAQLNAIATTGPTVAEVLAKGNDADPAPTPKPVGFDYAGRWATKPGLCGTDAWTFAAKTVAVGRSGRCKITRSDVRSSTETKLDTICTPVGGTISINERWSLVKRANGDMIVARTAGNSIPRSVTLTKCG